MTVLVDNDFKEHIKNAVSTLKNAGTILFPTATGWHIGCDATRRESVEKILSHKGGKRAYYCPCLFCDQAMLERYITKVPEVAYDIMDLSNKPTILILNTPKGLPDNMTDEKNTIATQIVSSKFCQYLMGAFRKPIWAIPVIVSKLTENLSAIPNEILGSVDYVVTLQQKSKKPVLPAIIKLGIDGTVQVIRE